MTKEIVNEKEMYLVNTNGILTFSDTRPETSFPSVRLADYFDIYVGMVTGKEEVFKNKEHAYRVLEGPGGDS